MKRGYNRSALVASATRRGRPSLHTARRYEPSIRESSVALAGQWHCSVQCPRPRPPLLPAYI